jgi:predicted Zn-dependent protease
MCLTSLSCIVLLTSSGQNTQKDIALGKQYSEYVESSVGVYENDALTGYIKSVGDKLTAQMERPLFEYQYTILATPEPNAFSIPGGHLYITTGMFPFLENEDELACIMAHEIIHANNRHVIKSNRKGIVSGILQIPGAIVGAVVDEDVGNALQAPFQRLGALTHASYSRKQETEADLEGIEIASKAGYDPNALKTILARIGKYGEIVSGEEEQKDRFATHPMTQDRLDKIDKVLPDLTKGESNYPVDDFLKIFDGALAGSDPAKGVFLDEEFLQPIADFKLLFPDDWETGFMGNLIAGINEESQEFMRITYEESEVDPSEAADQFLSNLNPYYRESVIGSNPIKVGEKIGHLIAFKEQNDGKTVYGTKSWVKNGDLLFSFLAVSLNEDQEKMHNIIYSLDSLSQEDIEKIQVPTLRVIKLDASESVESLIERTQTNLSEQLTRLINQKEESDEFEEGEEVKVVVPEKFKN